MKQLLLSADGDISVYSVPDAVADNLSDYCNEFDKWLWESPHAVEYRVAGPNGNQAVCYNEKDFIKYLNTWIFPDAPSQLVETLDGVWRESDVPEKYKHLEYFNF